MGHLRPSTCERILDQTLTFIYLKRVKMWGAGDDALTITFLRILTSTWRSWKSLCWRFTKIGEKISPHLTHVGTYDKKDSSVFAKSVLLATWFIWTQKIVSIKSGFPIHQFADFVRFLKNPVFWVRSFLSSVRSFFWPQLHHFWAQLDRFPVYLGLRWFESSISWKFYVGFHVKTNFQKLWKPQFSQLDKICAQLG